MRQFKIYWMGHLLSGVYIGEDICDALEKADMSTEHHYSWIEIKEKKKKNVISTRNRKKIRDL